MTRIALLAEKDGRVRRYATAEDPQAAEQFRVRLEAGLGVPVRAEELPVEHPAECTNCCHPAPNGGGGR